MKAWEIIEEYGWVKGKLGNSEKGFCILGAIGQKHRDIDINDLSDLNKDLCKVRNAVGHICRWNNNATREKVLTLLKRLDV